MWISTAFRCTARTTNQKFMCLSPSLSLSLSPCMHLHFFIHFTRYLNTYVFITLIMYTACLLSRTKFRHFLAILDEWNTLTFLQMLKHFEHTFSTLFDSLAQNEATNIWHCRWCRYYFLFSLNLFIHSFLVLSCGFAYVFWKWQTKWKHGKKEAKQTEQNIQKKAKTTKKKNIW